MIGWWRARRERTARIDRALLALEHAAVAAEAERARLAEATALSHRALAAMGDALERIAQQPARHDAVVDAAARRLGRSADDLGRDLARRVEAVGEVADRRVAAELGPVRDAAAIHARWMRVSLDRMRGEAEALDGARCAAAAVADLTVAAEGSMRHAAELLEAGAGRLLSAIDRVEGALPTPAQPPRRARG